MAIIIGAGTTVVSALFPNGGITSVNFGFQPQVQRLWQLGSFVPYDTFVQRQRTIQIGVYGSRADGSGGSVQTPVTPATSCTDADEITITVNPAACLSAISPFTEDYFINSYSYQKENIGYGQESWSFSSRPIFSNYNGTIVMLRGIAEGTISTGDGVMTSDQMGIIVDETASNDSFGAPIQGESGGVQAGSPGIGNFDIQRFIIATAVGGSIGLSPATDGLSGNGSVTIPLTPVFL